MREKIATANKYNIPLGKQGENEVTLVKFDVAGWKELYGDGYFILINLRPYDNEPYPCQITSDNEYVYWIIKNTDVANAGIGKCELSYISGDKVAKSVTYSTFVERSLEGAGDPPDPETSWVADVENAALDAEAYSVGTRNGIEVESSDPAYENNAKYYKEAAEDVLDSIPADYSELSAEVASQSEKIAKLDNEIPITTQSGYIYTNGTIKTATAAGEVYTQIIPVKTGLTTIKVISHFSQPCAQWVAIAQYKENDVFMKRDIFINETAQTTEVNIPISNPETKSIRLMWRTYGEQNTVSVYLLPQENNYMTRVDSIPIGFIKSINHRGYNIPAPENTLPAFKLSRKMGFHYVETDVCFTSDNVAVLLHDSTINRTARNSDGTELSSSKKINSITYDEASTYDFGIWKGTIYAGTKIPTFEQFIQLCRALGLHPYIELKSGNGTGGTQANIESLYPIVKRYGMLKNVTWISTNSGLLGSIRDIDSTARLGLITTSISSSELDDAESLKTSTNEVFIDCSLSGITDEAINSAIALDIPIEVWAPNDVTQIANLNPYISGVTSDKVIANEALYNIYIE